MKKAKVNFMCLLWCVLPLFLLANGCTVIPVPVSIESKTFYEPIVGESKEVTVGSVMVSKTHYSGQSCYIFRALKDYTCPSAGLFNQEHVQISKDKLYPACKRERKGPYVYLGGVYPNQTEHVALRITEDGYIGKKGGWMSEVFYYAVYNGEFIRPVQGQWTKEKLFELCDTNFLPGKGSFKEELLYSGRDGDNIKLSYREYSNDFARPAFYQEPTYNLNEGKTITFRNMKIEIIEANNETIKYVILKY